MYIYIYIYIDVYIIYMYIYVYIYIPLLYIHRTTGQVFRYFTRILLDKISLVILLKWKR